MQNLGELMFLWLAVINAIWLLVVVVLLGFDRAQSRPRRPALEPIPIRAKERPAAQRRSAA